MKHILLSAPVLCLVFLAILFLQSGLDKVFNYKANKDWIDAHFAKSPLSNLTGLMMPVITVLEVMSGVCSAIGIFTLIFTGDHSVGLIGAQLSCLSILCLFFGQRVAQDYEGAATLTTYFLISIASVFLLWDY